MNLKKEITFIYMDTAEKTFMNYLAEEAEKRGYQTTVTDDKFAKCEIGVYCQHVNFPQYSKFSVIMLHDIIQQYGNWPDIWYREPWNKYDIGILPSDQWVDNWNQCSQWFYTRPRMGMYKVGWPKADVVAKLDKESYRKNFYEKYGLDPNKKTVLYAPAWENDHKQDDFVQAMLPLGVNILIKQWDANPEKFPEVVKNIREMQELHANVKGVTILPPSMNIFDAIIASDILVSEESSTMSEAAMMGVPAVSVSNWLIPDVTPSRFPSCEYDFVEKTTKEALSGFIAQMVADYPTYRAKTEDYAKRNFSNIGRSCSMIIDIIEDAVSGKPIRYPSLTPQTAEPVPAGKKARFYLAAVKQEIRMNYYERSEFVYKTYNLLKSTKNKLLGRKS